MAWNKLPILPAKFWGGRGMELLNIGDPHTGLETRAFVTRIYHAHVSQVPNLKLIH